MAERRELGPSDYIRILKRRWFLIVALALVGAGTGYGLTRILPKRYISQTTVLVEQPTVSKDIVPSVVGDDTDQRLASMKQKILSRSRLEPVIQQFDLYHDDIKRLPMEELVARLHDTIDVSPIQPMAGTNARELPGFNVSVTFDDARQAQQICSTITSMFLEESLQLRSQQAEQTTDFLSKQLDDAKAKLDDHDATLATFKRKYIGSLPNEEQTNLTLLTNLATQLEAATESLGGAQQDKTFVQSMLEQQMTAWRASQVGQNPETLDKQLADLQLQLTSAQSKYTDNHPDTIKLKHDIETLKKKMADTDNQEKTAGVDQTNKAVVEPAQIQQLRAQIHQYDQIIKDRSAEQEQIQQQIKLYQARVQSSPAVEQEYTELSRGYQTALDYYNDLLKKRNESVMATDLERRQQGQQFKVFDPANLPDQPAFPKKLNFLLGGFGGGLCLGLGLCLLLEMQDTSLRSEQDVEFALQLPVLAILPVIPPGSGMASKNQAVGFGSARI
jgi:polysaccharide chain length determinant protein (PEP-CTERM system associated)